MSSPTLTDSLELGAAYGTEPAVESRRGLVRPATDYGDVRPSEGWWFTVEALFCRAFPDLSLWLYAVLGEDGHMLDE